MSFNNYLDSDSAFRLVSEFSITSLSLMDPPGWIIALIPTSCAIARAQRFGFDLKGSVMASEAFLESIKLKIALDRITAEDLKEVENRIRLERVEWVEKLKDIKGEIEKHLQQKLQEHLQKVKRP